MTTTFPKAQPAVNDWLRYINTPVLNLNLVNSTSIFGIIIIGSYQDEPYETIQMIRDRYRDNPKMVTETISLHNVKLLGL